MHAGKRLAVTDLSAGWFGFIETLHLLLNCKYYILHFISLKFNCFYTVNVVTAFITEPQLPNCHIDTKLEITSGTRGLLK